MFGRAKDYAGAIQKDQRLDMMRRWSRERRIFVEPFLVSDKTRAEMRRGAERTGSPDPFGSKVTMVSIGDEIVLREPTDEFPTENMIAQISLALEAGMDRELTYSTERDQWEKRRG